MLLKSLLNKRNTEDRRDNLHQPEPKHGLVSLPTDEQQQQHDNGTKRPKNSSSPKNACISKISSECKVNGSGTSNITNGKQTNGINRSPIKHTNGVNTSNQFSPVNDNKKRKLDDTKKQIPSNQTGSRNGIGDPTPNKKLKPNQPIAQVEEKIKAQIQQIQKILSNPNPNTDSIQSFLSNLKTTNPSKFFLETSGLPALLKDIKQKFSNDCLAKDVYRIMKERYKNYKENQVVNLKEKINEDIIPKRNGCNGTHVNHATNKKKGIYPFRAKVGNVVILRHKPTSIQDIYETKGTINDIKVSTKISHTKLINQETKWTKPNPMIDDGYMLIGKIIRFPLLFLTSTDTAVIQGEIISIAHSTPTDNAQKTCITVQILLEEETITKYNLQKHVIDQKKHKIEEYIQGKNKVKVNVRLPSPWNNQVANDTFWEILKPLDTFLGEVIDITVDPKTSSSLSNNQPINTSLAKVTLKRLYLPEQTQTSRLISHHKFNEVFDYKNDDFIHYWRVDIEDIIVVSNKLIRYDGNKAISNEILQKRYGLSETQVMIASYSYNYEENKFIPFVPKHCKNLQVSKISELQTAIGKKTRFCHRCRRVNLNTLIKCNEVTCNDKRVKWWCESCCDYLQTPHHTTNNWIGPCCLSKCDCVLCQDTVQEKLEHDLKMAFMDRSNHVSKRKSAKGEVSDQSLKNDGDICKNLLDAVESATSVTFDLPVDYGKKRKRHDLDDISCARCVDVHSWKQIMAREEERNKKKATFKMDERDYNLMLRQRCFTKLDKDDSLQDNDASPQNNEILYNLNEVIAQLKNSKHEQNHLRFGKSPIHQWGVFTTKPIPKNTMIIEYVGEIISHALADVREIQYSKNNSFKFCDYMFRIDDKVCDAMRFGNLARFINASCDPNCYTDIVEKENENDGSVSKHIVIFSKRDIEVGEELCYDYKFPIEHDSTKWIKCRCQAKNCRGYMNV